jgi:branched-chain amino acid transport system substrate-binding protein
MQRRHWRTPLAIGMAAALTLAACGDDDDDGADASTPAAATEDTAAATPDTATEETDATADTTTGDTATEDTASDDTASDDTASDDTASDDTAAAGSGELGLIDGVYTGAGDFVIDPADCPEDWDPAQGITDEEIKLFVSLPKAGPFAGFGLIADGMQSYFDYVYESEGGIDGRKITLDVKDDGYLPDKTKTNVDEALGSGEYASLVAVLGTANNLAVWDEVNDECMPQLFNATGAPNWGDVENHPWTTGKQIDYFTEAGLWAEWLEAEHPDAKTVAAVAFNNDFGKSYVDGFERAIEGTDIEVVEQQFHEPTAPDLTNQFTTMAASNADVVLVETSGTFCTQAMAELEKNTSWDPIVIISGTCQSLSQFFQPLIDQGLTGAGVNLIQYLKDVNDVAFAEDPFVQLFHETLQAQGLDDKQTTYATGWLIAWYMVEVLKNASTYEGGLDRGNIMLSARNQDVQNPLVLDGIQQQVIGFDDAYLNEGGRMAVYEVADPAQLGTFVPSGDVIDNNGSIGNFSDISGG